MSEIVTSLFYSASGMHFYSQIICVLFFVCVNAGSGDLAALGILEDGFKHDLEVQHLNHCS